MVQILANETILCPACKEEHECQLIAFPKKLEYKGQLLELAEFYHSCPNDKVLIQTDKDVIETFKLERRTKNEIDKAIASQQYYNNMQT